MKAVPTAHLVQQLRSLMAERGLSAYFIPSGDPHMSEYTPLRYRRREYISGFDGSAGTALVTKNEALLWTDGRYFLQASQQLETPLWTLMKAGITDVPTIEKWLVSNLEKNAAVGFDACTLSVEQHDKLKEALTARKRSALRLQATENLVDLLWQQDTERPMPALPQDKIFIHELKFAGKTVKEKLEQLSTDMKKEKVGKILLTALDDIAWLLNLRCSDIDCTPVFIAYCIATTDATATLFVNEAKLNDAVREHLGSSGVEIRPYEAVGDALADTSQVDVEYSYDAAQCNVHLFNVMNSNPVIESSPRTSLVTVAKAVKSERELQGMKDCHIRDAVALVKYFRWLEDCVAHKVPVTECLGADKLFELRRQLDHFVSLSFETISSAGANASIIHYHPARDRDVPITEDTMYLVDSGGQYFDGTTDVTRTMHFGQPTAKQVEAFTRVLKGHLALRLAVVPNTVTGPHVDSWARAALWEVGLDYRHGTGHGVGHFLNVHEGPHGIGQRPNTQKLQAGYVVSNEPGYYEDGEFGIRIENLCYFKESARKYSMGGVTFLELDDLTMVPIQSKLVDVTLLTDRELEQLNEYHRRVLANVGPLLADDAATAAWLQSACAPLAR